MKRFIDILLSGIGVATLLPVFCIVAIGLKISSPGPVFFRQKRMGRHGVPFMIFKFRTMDVQNNDDGCQVTAGGDSRIHTFGKFLRYYKLDELPQLINILQGDMALVGPRPEVLEFAALFPSEYQSILQVRPGITHPVTLLFRREEEILATSSNPREFYLSKVLPEKLGAYESNLEQSFSQNILTIFKTIFPVGQFKPYGPEHFGVLKGCSIIPFPSTDVENIPAFPNSLSGEREALKADSAVQS